LARKAYNPKNQFETLEVKIPKDLAQQIDEILDLLDFRNREEFALAAIRRLTDHYIALRRQP